MLAILTDEHILSAQKVCSSCLLATRQGNPRWYGGNLGCGRILRDSVASQPALYECQMGFKLVEIGDNSLSVKN